jgi:hypothetical protein
MKPRNRLRYGIDPTPATRRDLDRAVQSHREWLWLLLVLGVRPSEVDTFARKLQAAQEALNSN